jgi:release factor glutamine methyltransferase
LIPPLTPPPTVSATQAHLTRRLAQAGLPSAVPEARALLMHVLRLDWTGLVLAAERELLPAQVEQIEALTLRRLAREPLQHLLGSVEWGGLTLTVSPAALIPRPETEVLLGHALQVISGLTRPRVLDVGTGSGALALGIKAACPDAAVTATDLSPEALDLARRNADLNGLEVQFLLADVLEGVSGPFDLIVSNPPYLPEGDRLSAQPEVRHDPEMALYSGVDGLVLARRLALGARAQLAVGGVLLLELDPRNVDVLAGEMARWAVEVFTDLAGVRRFLWAGLDG